MDALHKYVYDGPVLVFNDLVAPRWIAETMAKSEAKARSNLTYQFKKQNRKEPNVKVTLPGKIVMVR